MRDIVAVDLGDAVDVVEVGDIVGVVVVVVADKNCSAEQDNLDCDAGDVLCYPNTLSI
jgi:D-arabinose 1-dehydrogenase-like Zn-dependent alcohol dehydrogenase